MPGWHISSGGGGGGGGTGDVVGPASSTDNAIVRFDLATGKLLQNSDLFVTDAAILPNYSGILAFGGTTAAFPGLSRVSTSGTELRVVLADLSAFAPLRAGSVNVSASGVGNLWSENLLNVGTAGTWGTSGIYQPLAGVHNWSAAPSGGGGDTGLARDAAAVVKATDGGAGLGTFKADTFRAASGASTYILMSTAVGVVALGSGIPLIWSNAATYTGNADTGLSRIAAGQVAVNNATNGMANNIKIATTTVNAAGATSTAANLVPAGCILLGVTTRVTTAITSGDGGTSVDIGNGTDVDMYGDNIAFALGTTTTLASHTASALAFVSAAQNVVFTCVGGTFATGVWRVCAHYLDLTAPTS